LALTPERSTLHAVICVDLAEQLVDIGELTQADELLSIAEGNPEVAPLATLPRLEWLHLARPSEAISTIESKLPGLLKQFSEAKDEHGLAKVHLLAWSMHWLASHAIPAAKEAELAAEHASAAGDRGLQARALSLELPPLVRGIPHVRDLARRLDELERAGVGPYVMARVMLGRAWLALLEGRYPDGRAFARRAIDAYEALGMRLMASGCRNCLAEIELAAGDPAAARRYLLESDEAAAVMDERGYRSTIQALLAETEEVLGNREAALAAIELSDELSAPQDVVNYAITHSVRARLALLECDGASAEQWARSAVHYAFLTDFPQAQGRAKFELARVLRSLGRGSEAAVEARAALDLFNAKGDRPGAEQAQALLDALSGSD
jgi:tetratricopeptide (TPR) repeat protein